MMNRVKRFFRNEYKSFEDKLASEAFAGNLEPLLEACLTNKIKWGSGGYRCFSDGGNFEVENDGYYYFRVRGKSIAYLPNAGQMVVSRITAASINNTMIGAALSDDEITSVKEVDPLNGFRSKHDSGSIKTEFISRQRIKSDDPNHPWVKH